MAAAEAPTVTHVIAVVLRRETRQMDQSRPEFKSDLADLSELSLEEFLYSDQDSLAPVMQRVLDRIDDSHGSISGYNPQRLA